MIFTHKLEKKLEKRFKVLTWGSFILSIVSLFYNFYLSALLFFISLFFLLTKFLYRLSDLEKKYGNNFWYTGIKADKIN